MREKKRREKIRSQLGTRKLSKQIHERKRNWLKHLQRISSERVPKQLNQPIGRRDPGRSRKRWNNV
jgi:hypothetical protein